ncbi:TetR/AcrR family transcriptional regulator [Viridibacillus sp. FSL R5-0888]
MGLDKKELIVQTATNLFRKKGYLGVGISEILTECNLSKGGFYHHFPNGKEELLITCLNSMNEVITQDIKEIFGRYQTTQAAIQAMLEELIIQFDRDETIIGYTFNSIVSEIGSVSERVREACEDSFTKIQEIYSAKLMADGYSKEEANSFALMMTATIEGGIMLCLTKKTSEPLQTIASLLPNTLKVV